MFIYDIMFNGIALSDMGGYLTSNNDELNQLVPTYEIITHTVPNVGEEKFIKKIKKPYEFRVEMFFKEIDNVVSIRKWLDTSSPQEFLFIPDICEVGKLKVILSDYIIPEVYPGEGDTYNVIVSAKFKEYVV